MGVIEAVITVLAGLAAVGTAIVQIGLWWRGRRAAYKNKPQSRPDFLKGHSRHLQPIPSASYIPESTCDRLVPLTRMAYVLLRLDQLPNVGNWGFTINKYIELNYPHDQEILARKDSYLRDGSITHTAHALRGLGFMRMPVPNIDPDLIRRWVELNSTEVGLVAPTLPANPDEVRGLAKEIRHTASAMLALLRLRSHIPNESSIHEIDRWVESHGRMLLGFAGVWIHDPRMTYTHAYLLELFDMLKREPSYASMQAQLDRQISHGLEQVFGMISIENPYWCADTHPETKVFYTLLILARVLSLPEAYDERMWVDRTSACLEEVGRIARRLGGVPLGQGSQDSRFGAIDLGATAAFLECCYRACGFGVPLEHLVRLAANCVDKAASNIHLTTANAITHTWESVLSLLETAGIGESLDPRSFSREVEPFLDELRQQLGQPREFPRQLIQDLAGIVGYQDHMALCFDRDLWQSAVRRSQVVSVAGYLSPT